MNIRSWTSHAGQSSKPKVKMKHLVCFIGLVVGIPVRRNIHFVSFELSVRVWKSKLRWIPYLYEQNGCFVFFGTCCSQ
jgi:hypothetical protein